MNERYKQASELFDTRMKYLVGRGWKMEGAEFVLRYPNMPGVIAAKVNRTFVMYAADDFFKDQTEQFLVR